jgi:hypothetical protein
MKDEQRAWVYPEVTVADKSLISDSSVGFAIDEMRGISLKLNVTFHNTGHLPARDVAFFSRIYPFSAGLASLPPKCKGNADAPGISVFPGQVSTIRQVSVGRSPANGKAFDADYLVKGCVVYRSGSDTAVHVTEWDGFFEVDTNDSKWHLPMDVRDPARIRLEGARGTGERAD